MRRVERLVRDEVARISRLVDDLLLLAKSDHAEQFLRLEPIELEDYLGELWDGMTLLADRRFELGELPRGVLSADRDRLAQALRNLIANAIDHTSPDVGLVRMRVRDDAGGRIRFLVEDDGPGIPPGERERIFERFHRIDSARDRASGRHGPRPGDRARDRQRPRRQRDGRRLAGGGRVLGAGAAGLPARARGATPRGRTPAGLTRG